VQIDCTQHSQVCMLKTVHGALLGSEFLHHNA
jgi:hypothetical protein